jgi:GNAT superfamily N-acetyltransferase
MNLYDTLRSLAPDAVRRYVRGINAVNLHLQCKAEALAPLDRDITPFAVRMMDAGDPREIGAWTRIQRQGFGAQIEEDAFDRLVLSHPAYDIRHTHFLLEDGQPVGAASGGVYRRNPSIGVGHQVTVLPHLRGRGLGRHLILYRYHALHADGIRLFETETTLFYRQGIVNNFSVGLQPKLRRDSWNQRDDASDLQRLIANALLESRYLAWRARHG